MCSSADLALFDELAALPASNTSLDAHLRSPHKHSDPASIHNDEDAIFEYENPSTVPWVSPLGAPLTVEDNDMRKHVEFKERTLVLAHELMGIMFHPTMHLRGPHRVNWINTPHYLPMCNNFQMGKAFHYCVLNLDADLNNTRMRIDINEVLTLSNGAKHAILAGRYTVHSTVVKDNGRAEIIDSVRRFTAMLNELSRG